MRFLTFSLSCILLTSAVQAKPVRVNGIAAKANGDVITMNELMVELAPIQSVLMARFPRRGAAFEQNLKQQRDRILDELIDRTIIFTEFKDRLTNIPDRAIEDEVDKFIERRHAGDRELFRKYLKATNLTYEQFKEQRRKNLTVQIVRNQQFPDLPPPTQAELNEAYKEWKKDNRDRKKDVGTYRKIYLRKGLNKETALKKAEEIVTQLKAGADFGELAKNHSTDSKAAEGGLWSNVPRTDLNPEFGVILFDLEEDGVIGPIEDQYGITILRVLERKLGPSKPLSQVKEEVTNRVNGKKRHDAIEAWMKKLRARTPVQRMIE